MTGFIVWKMSFSSSLASQPPVGRLPRRSTFTLGNKWKKERGGGQAAGLSLERHKTFYLFFIF
jgi:hypothetical protein